MKTVLVCSILCALSSFLALVGLSMVLVEAPTPWDPTTIVSLVALASALFWLGGAVWAGWRLRRKKPHAVPLWLRISVMLIAAVYVGTVLFTLYTML